MRALSRVLEQVQVNWCLRHLLKFNTRSGERCSNWSFKNPNPNQRIALRTVTETLLTHHARGVRGVHGRWRCVDTYHARNSAFLLFNCGLFFLLKYSLRRAVLQLEFRWSKPDEPHSEQSKPVRQQTAFLLVGNTENWNHIQIPRVMIKITQTRIVQNLVF